MAAKKQKQMVSEALKAKCMEAAEARASIESGAVEGKYRLGTIAKEVMDDEATFGVRDMALKKLAKAAGYKKDILYDAAKVVRVWTLDDVKTPALSWNHFVELAEIEDVEERRRWLVKCVEEKLSVRKLRLRGEEETKTPPIDVITKQFNRAHRVLEQAEKQIEISWELKLSTEERHEAKEAIFALNKRLNQLYDRIKFGRQLQNAEPVVGTFQQASVA